MTGASGNSKSWMAGLNTARPGRKHKAAKPKVRTHCRVADSRPSGGSAHSTPSGTTSPQRKV
ncbi:MAG: hypothetical protein A3H91_11595 [Gammaproteobacteria bacterium RIFCSPLOWO2_02_FULL_61_13]|nr:MAG: hypothetical protein A3H91_11595 [Gammaproteobacteria bacterium RIFCSPLOWO2_02_FULL_61_13]